MSLPQRRIAPVPPPAAKPTEKPKKTRRIFSDRVKLKDLNSFTQQLGTLLLGGVSIVSALQALLETHLPKGLAHALKHIKEDVETGIQFYEALRWFPKIFPPTYVNMAKAGCESGKLGETMKELARYMAKEQKTRNKIKSAMTYPIVVMCMAVAILFFLMTFIVPKFEQIFAELLNGGRLPVLTRFVMGVSRGVAGNIVPIVLACALIPSAVMLARKFKKIAFWLDRAKLNSPVFGDLMRKSYLSRFCSTLSSLLHTGVMILPALRIVRDVCPNLVIQKAIQTLHDSVKEGDPVNRGMELSRGVFPSTLIAMVKVGEQTGKMDEMLRNISDNYEDEVDNAVAAMTSIIEPVLIVFLAVVVGTIVIALFMPLIQIIGGLSNS